MPASSANAKTQQSHDQLHRAIAEISAKLQQLQRSITQSVPILPVVQPSLLVALRDQLKQPTATFRSFQQAEAIQVASERSTHLLAILPTGEGKTDIFLLNAMCERRQNKTTVVMVPLVRLRDQHVRLAEDRGLLVHHWPSQTVGDVLVVIFEYAAVDAFINKLREWHAAGKLARIVVDECHYLFAAKADFRQKMHALSILGSIGVPLVLLTGTLPPPMVADQLRLVGISTAREVRAPTTRHNLQYSFRRVDMSKYCTKIDTTDVKSYASTVIAVLDAAFATVRPPIAQTYPLNTPSNKRTLVIVFFQRTDLIDEIHKHRPNWFRIHAGMSDKQQEENLGKWGSVGEVMLASSILGLGFHRGNVRGSFHWELPRNMCDFAQESGRVGRDGKPGWCVVLWHRLPQKPLLDDWGKGILIDGAASGVCRRFMLDTFMDGSGTTCITHRNGTAFCDNCQIAFDQHETEAHELIAARPLPAPARKSKIPPMDLQALLDLLKLNCVACFLAGRGMRDHLHIGCNEATEITLEPGQSLSTAYKLWKQQIVIPGERGICFKCHLPQTATWHAGRINERCHYADIVPSAVFHAAHIPDLQLYMMEKFDCQVAELARKLHEWAAHIQTTGFLNETTMFEWVCEQVLHRHG